MQIKMVVDQGPEPEPELEPEPGAASIQAALTEQINVLLVDVDTIS